MRPADPTRPVTCPYGKKGSAWATGEHGGVDFGCPEGDPVYAMWAGTVTGQSWGTAYGRHVVIDHDRLPGDRPGLWAVYAHLSRIDVRPGERVQAGQRIGLSGATGNVTGPHLHVEVQRDSRWRRGNYTNPQPWIDAEGGDPMGQYEYSGKPSGKIRVPAGDYARIDADVPDPRTGATEFQNLYANCDLEWQAGGTDGWVQVKYVRENGDSTGYQTYAVNSTMPALLITATHWEKGEAGQGGRWWIKCGGQLTAIVVGTRYVKLAVV